MLDCTRRVVRQRCGSRPAVRRLRMTCGGGDTGPAEAGMEDTFGCRPSPGRVTFRSTSEVRFVHPGCAVSFRRFRRVTELTVAIMPAAPLGEWSSVMWRRLASQTCCMTVRFVLASAGPTEGGHDERRKAVVRTRARSGCSERVARAALWTSGSRFGAESVRIREGATIPRGARRRRLLRLRASVTFTGTKGTGRGGVWKTGGCGHTLEWRPTCWEARARDGNVSCPMVFAEDPKVGLT